MTNVSKVTLEFLALARLVQSHTVSYNRTAETLFCGADVAPAWKSLLVIQHAREWERERERERAESQSEETNEARLEEQYAPHIYIRAPRVKYSPERARAHIMRFISREERSVRIISSASNFSELTQWLVFVCIYRFGDRYTGCVMKQWCIFGN